MGATKTNVVIKGTKAGLMVILAEEPSVDTIIAELADRMGEGAGFFQGASIILNVGNRVLETESWLRLRDLLAAHAVTLKGVVAADEITRRSARALGFTLASPIASLSVPARPATATPGEGSEGILVRRTLRSGQSLRHPGHVVILGDVNAGAEVIAGGDILVWGVLRGMAHAGALGDTSAGIYALHLAPTQLRIGGLVASQWEKRSTPPKPEVARVKNGQIVIEEWGST